MEDDPNKPITVSEIPPRRQPSGMSFFSRLDRSHSALSESSSHYSTNIDSSPSKSFTQTMIEKWVTITSSQRYVDEAPDDLLPPWVAPIRPVQRNISSGIDSPPAIEEEEEVQDFDNNSECSLLQITDKEIESNSIEDYPVLNNRETSRSLSSETDEELEAYRTPRPEFSPKSHSTESLQVESTPEENYLPHSPPMPYKAFRNKNTNNDDNDSQETQSCDSQLIVQTAATSNRQTSIKYDSQETTPYDSQETVPYDVLITMPSDNQLALSSGNQQTLPSNNQLPTTSDHQSNSLIDLHASEAFHSDYDPSIDTQISTSYNHCDNPNIPATYTHVQYNTETRCSSNSSLYENVGESASKASSPCQFASPVNDNDSLPHLSPEPVKLDAESFNDLLSDTTNEVTLNEIDFTASRKHYLQDDGIIISSSRSNSFTKMQKLDTNDLSVENPTQNKGKSKESSSIKSQETITLVRPEKKQIRSSVLKKPITIENYFVNSSAGASQEERELDIGRDSVEPSFRYSNAEVIKEDKNDSNEPIDRRRRPRFGLSKTVFK